MVGAFVVIIKNLNDFDYNIIDEEAADEQEHAEESYEDSPLMLFKNRYNLLGSHLMNFHLDLDLLQLEQKQIEHYFITVLYEELDRIEYDI